MNELEKALGLINDDDFEFEDKKDIEPSFEIVEAPQYKKDLIDVDNIVINQNQIDDYEYSRQTLIHLITQGNEALHGLLKIGALAESPHAFDTISKLLKSIADMSKDLAKVNADMKQQKPESKTTQSAQTINNTQVVMSQTEVIDMLSNKDVISN